MSSEESALVADCKQLGDKQGHPRQLARKALYAVGDKASRLIDYSKSSSSVLKFGIETVSKLVQPATSFTRTQWTNYGDPLLDRLDRRIDETINVVQHLTATASTSSSTTGQEVVPAGAATDPTTAAVFLSHLKEKFMRSRWFSKADEILLQNAFVQTIAQKVVRPAEMFYNTVTEEFPKHTSYESFVAALRIRIGPAWDERLGPLARAFHVTAGAVGTMVGAGKLVGGALQLGRCKVNSVLDDLLARWDSVLGFTDEALDRWLPDTTPKVAGHLGPAPASGPMPSLHLPPPHGPRSGESDASIADTDDEEEGEEDDDSMMGGPGAGVGGGRAGKPQPDSSRRRSRSRRRRAGAGARRSRDLDSFEDSDYGGRAGAGTRYPLSPDLDDDVDEDIDLDEEDEEDDPSMAGAVFAMEMESQRQHQQRRASATRRRGRGSGSGSGSGSSRSAAAAAAAAPAFAGHFGGTGAAPTASAAAADGSCSSWASSTSSPSASSSASSSAQPAAAPAVPQPPSTSAAASSTATGAAPAAAAAAAAAGGGGLFGMLGFSGFGASTMKRSKSRDVDLNRMIDEVQATYAPAKRGRKGAAARQAASRGVLPLAQKLSSRLKQRMSGLMSTTSSSSSSSSSLVAVGPGRSSMMSSLTTLVSDLQQQLTASSWFARVDEILLQNTLVQALAHAARPAEHLFRTAVDLFYSLAARATGSGSSSSSAGSALQRLVPADEFVSQLRARLGLTWDDRLVAPAKSFYLTAISASSSPVEGRSPAGSSSALSAMVPAAEQFHMQQQQQQQQVMMMQMAPVSLASIQPPPSPTVSPSLAMGFATQYR